jgi:DNA-binding response OmpR family regulator
VDLVVLDEDWLGARPDAPLNPDGVPVIVVIRRDDPARAVTLLESGVDDVVRDPFDEAEVRARAESLLRRSRRAATPRRSTQLYDPLRREVRRADGTRRRLTASESIVLESLLDAGGDVVHRESLLARLVDQPLRVESNIVERHVATLRAKLGDDRRSQRLIATVPRHGYRFAPAALTQA